MTIYTELYAFLVPYKLVKGASATLVITGGTPGLAFTVRSDVPTVVVGGGTPIPTTFVCDGVCDSNGQFIGQIVPLQSSYVGTPTTLTLNISFPSLLPPGKIFGTNPWIKSLSITDYYGLWVDPTAEQLAEFGSITLPPAPVPIIGAAYGPPVLPVAPTEPVPYPAGSMYFSGSYTGYNETQSGWVAYGNFGAHGYPIGTQVFINHEIVSGGTGNPLPSGFEMSTGSWATFGSQPACFYDLSPGVFTFKTTVTISGFGSYEFIWGASSSSSAIPTTVASQNAQSYNFALIDYQSALASYPSALAEYNAALISYNSQVAAYTSAVVLWEGTVGATPLGTIDFVDDTPISGGDPGGGTGGGGTGGDTGGGTGGTGGTGGGDSGGTPGAGYGTYSDQITIGVTGTVASTNAYVSNVASVFGEYIITETFSGDVGRYNVRGPSGFLACFYYRYDSTDAIATATSRGAAFRNCSETINAKIRELSDDQRELISRNVQKQIRDVLELTRLILSDQRDDIRALKILGVDYDKGIVTRGTCKPCHGGWGSNIQRALAIVALREARTLSEVIKEAGDPTVIPEFDDGAPWI